MFEYQPLPDQHDLPSDCFQTALQTLHFLESVKGSLLLRFHPEARARALYVSCDHTQLKPNTIAAACFYLWLDGFYL